MPTLINVCGSARSGSTMLDLMLGNAPDAFSCGEVSAWFRPYRRHHFRIDCSCGESPCPAWEKFKNVPESRFHAAVFRALDVDFVIDSSKELCWVVDAQGWAAANGIRTFNLLIWKDPIDQAYSHWKRGQGLSYWRKPFVGYYGKFLSVGLPFKAVYFNDLVRDPRRKLAEICEFVGMSYFDGKERFWEKQHHYLFGSGGVRNQVKAGASTIRARQDFPPEFEAHIDNLAKSIEDDLELRHILEVLQRAEISSVGDVGAGDQAVLPRKPYPFWYYGLRIRELYRRYFPENANLAKLY